MTEKIKPIETVYHGIRYRSRLEARYAVFFDLMRVAFEYEPEGYDINGRWYLPDFYLPRFDCHVEIKPTRKKQETLTGELFRLMRGFADMVGPITCFCGPPTADWHGIVYCWDMTDSGAGGPWQFDIGFAYCEKCKQYTLQICDRDTRYLRGNRTLFYSCSFDKVWKAGCDPEHRETTHIGELVELSAMARGSRFENGKADYPDIRWINFANNYFDK